MIADSKKTEFGTLFKKSAQEFLKKPEGQTHLLRYEEGRATGRANFNAIQAAKSRGEDTTDSVLRLLLPYTDSAAHRSSGVWVHVAPSIQGDVKEWFQQAGWTRPEDWPKVAEAILEFVSRCVEDPTSLQANCHDFDDLPYTTGFQTGLLTPILNALRPDEFMIVNSKSLRVINFFTAQALKQRLIDYAATNAAGRALVSDISSDMQQYAASDGR
jgi:5-methylcytosine-specific restriction enzyme B